jgi:pyruvate dehydrogenase E1 component
MGDRVVPIVPDEARTFGMEGMFRQMGIYSHVGQLYTPEDSAQMMYYKEDKKGRMLEEGINEAGAMSAWIAVGTSYCMHNYPMIPFYIFYSMFGFQRIGDLAWAAGDIQAKAFCWGQPVVEPRSMAKAYSIKMAIHIYWPVPCPIVWLMTRVMVMN